jgi:hypothetical protein
MIAVDKKKTIQITLEKPLKKWIEKQENYKPEVNI